MLKLTLSREKEGHMFLQSLFDETLLLRVMKKARIPG